MDRVSAANMTPAEFAQFYEAKELPCIIADIPELEGWAAWHGKHGGAWSLASLEHKYADCKFKCGEDDAGYAIKIKMRCRSPLTF